VSVASPRDASRRGAHVAIAHPDAQALCAELIDRGVIVDFRRPDVIRLGLSPLITRFVDVWDGIDALRGLLAGRTPGLDRGARTPGLDRAAKAGG
jgi:kynureninase